LDIIPHHISFACLWVFKDLFEPWKLAHKCVFA